MHVPWAEAHGPSPGVIAEQPLDGGLLQLRQDAGTLISLVFRDALGHEQNIPCDPLDGAWGLWVSDLDGGESEVLIALRRPARFDPVPENRLHVYALAGGQCVPLWRGTRLAGRFDELEVQGGRLLALERVGRGERRLAGYRWTGFGYAVEEVLWQGRGQPPAEIRQRWRKSS